MRCVVEMRLQMLRIIRVKRESTIKVKNAQTQPKQMQNVASSVQGEPRYSKRHLVKQGETLTEITTRIRPQGMTVEQVIQALVKPTLVCSSIKMPTICWLAKY